MISAACCAGLSAARSTARPNWWHARTRPGGQAQRAQARVVGRLALVVAIAVCQVGLDAGRGGVGHELVDARAKDGLKMAYVEPLVLGGFAAVGEAIASAPTGIRRRRARGLRLAALAMVPSVFFGVSGRR